MGGVPSPGWRLARSPFLGVDGIRSMSYQYGKKLWVVPVKSGLFEVCDFSPMVVMSLRFGDDLPVSIAHYHIDFFMSGGVEAVVGQDATGE